MDDRTNPVSEYGKSKLAGEKAIEASGDAYLIFRTSWVYASRGKNFLLTMLRLANEREELRIVDDQFGAPTWCRTIAEGTAHVVAKLCAAGQDRTRSRVWPARHLSLVLRAGAFPGAVLRGRSSTSCEAGAMGPPEADADYHREYPLPARRPANSVLSNREAPGHPRDFLSGLGPCSQPLPGRSRRVEDLPMRPRFWLDTLSLLFSSPWKHRVAHRADGPARSGGPRTADR